MTYIWNFVAFIVGVPRWRVRGSGWHQFAREPRR
jgi:hypothetical protein